MCNCNSLNWDKSRVQFKKLRGQEINGTASLIKLWKLEMSVGNYPFNLFRWIEYFIRAEQYLKYHLVCHTYKLNWPPAPKIFPEANLCEFPVEVGITGWSRARDHDSRRAAQPLENLFLMMEHKSSVTYRPENVNDSTWGEGLWTLTYKANGCLLFSASSMVASNCICLKLTKNKIWRDLPNVTHCLDGKATNLGYNSH